MNLIFERYLERLNRARREASTIKNHGIAFRRFDDYCRDNGIDPVRATDLELEEYFSSLLGKLARSTVGKELTSIRSAYAYAVRQKLVERDPTGEVELPDPDDIEPETLTNEQLRAIYGAIEDEREELLFLCFAYTGMRRFEVQSLAFEQLDFENALIRNVIGKRKKRRNVPMHPALQDALVRVDANKRPGRRYVFESNRVERLSLRHLDRIMERLHKRAGVSMIGNCHVYRRTVATVLFERGVRETVIDTIMGWAPKTIREKHYLGRKDASINEAILTLYQDDPISVTHTLALVA